MSSWRGGSRVKRLTLMNVGGGGFLWEESALKEGQPGGSDATVGTQAGKVPVCLNPFWKGGKAEN